MYTAVVTILASRLAAGVVTFDSVSEVVISAAADGAPISSTWAALRVVRGTGIYGIVNVPFQLTLQGNRSGEAVTHVTPANGVVSFLDRQVSIFNKTPLMLLTTLHAAVKMLRCYAHEMKCISYCAALRRTTKAV